MRLCEVPSCESKDEDIRYLQHWICERCWDYYAAEFIGQNHLSVRRMKRLRKLLRIEEKKDRTLIEYPVWNR